ncbi:MAG: hypothetical protein RMM09_09990 [Armatimonadota bacterium]|nr:hypothetical protein [Armatimonadota bacterium]
MLGWVKRGGWVLVAVSLVFPAAHAAEPEAFMRLAEIRPGMRGVGRTVIRGTRVEEFSFEVLGTTEGPSGRLVLFRAYGPVIEQAGGVAAGMSGSPMYLQGRLAGALSYSYVFAGPDRNLGLFTPIERMLELLEAGRPAAHHPGLMRLDRPLRLGGRTVDHILVARDVASGRAASARMGIPAFAPVVTPLVVSGLGDRAFRLLRASLSPLPVVPVQGYGGVGRFPEAPLVPGSAVGVALARGDVNLVAFGTLTYRRGRRFLGLGHQMLGSGESAYMLTTAYIHTVVRSLEMSFKEGDLGNVVGTVTRDRAAGIGGELGRLPRIFNVVVRVVDRDGGRSLQLGTHMVRRRDLAQALIPGLVLSAIERGWDASGGGTAEVRIAARARGLPRPVERTNRVYSARDVAAAAVLDVVEATRILFHNEFAPLEPVDLSVEVTLTRRPLIASVVEVEAEHRTVPQGGKLRVRLRLRPFQEEQWTRVVEIQVPQNFPRGPALLVVGSAGSSREAVDPTNLLLSRVAGEPQPTRFDSLEQELEFFERFGRNTDVLLQLIPTGIPPSDDPAKRFIYFDAFAGEILPTDWVVRGEVVIPIVVE